MFPFLSPPIRYPLPVAPTWRLGWGQHAQWDGATWQEGPLAIAVGAGRSVEVQLAFSPSGRFVVVGDIWLSDRASLLSNLALENPLHLSDIQLVAIAWERWQSSVLPKLVGSFCLAVWDRERQVLRLARDPAGARTLYFTPPGGDPLGGGGSAIAGPLPFQRAGSSCSKRLPLLRLCTWQSHPLARCARAGYRHPAHLARG